MSSKMGPKINNNGLVLYYDDDNVHSYPGEPTTNLLSDGNFEDVSDTWVKDYKTDGEMEKYTLESYSGTKCMRCRNSTINSIALWKPIEVTSGNQYTVSVYAKNISCPTTPYFSSAGVSVTLGTVSFTGINETWQRFVSTFTANASGTLTLYIRTNGNATQGDFLVDEFQIEEKDHVTPFVEGSRLSTNGLLDLSGNNNHGNLVSSSYDSDAQIYMDGTTADRYIRIPYNSSYMPTDVFTWELVITPENNGVSGIEDCLSQAWNTFRVITTDGEGISYGVKFVQRIGGVDYIAYSAANVLSFGQIVHITLRYDGSYIRIYINGKLSGTPVAATGTVYTNTSDVLTAYPGRIYQGYIHLIKFYNAVISDEEILNNYKMIKKRFNL